MTDFTITEDFPKSEIEFDDRFSNPKACYDYLFKQKWPMFSPEKNAAITSTGSVLEIFIFAPGVSAIIH